MEAEAIVRHRGESTFTLLDRLPSHLARYGGCLELIVPGTDRVGLASDEPSAREKWVREDTSDVAESGKQGGVMSEYVDALQVTRDRILHSRRLSFGRPGGGRRSGVPTLVDS